MSKDGFPTELDCFKCDAVARNKKTSEINDIAKKCRESGHECKAKSSFISAEMKHKPSGFFAGKSNKDQRLQIADEIDNCNGLLDNVEDIDICSHKGVISGSILDCSVSKIKMFPEISDRLFQGLLEIVTKYRDELKEAKIQIEDEQLVK